VTRSELASRRVRQSLKRTTEVNRNGFNVPLVVRISAKASPSCQPEHPRDHATTTMPTNRMTGHERG
jgi:hypothetical protein